MSVDLTSVAGGDQRVRKVPFTWVYTKYTYT